MRRFAKTCCSASSAGRSTIKTWSKLSLKLRYEDETANLKERNTLPWSTLKRNDETRLDLKYQRSSDNWVNDAHLTFEDAYIRRRPRTIAPGYVLTTSDPGQVILNAGGGRDSQTQGPARCRAAKRPDLDRACTGSADTS